MDTVALIAAAGASRRMGFPKQLLAWNDTTLLQDTIKKIQSLPVTEVLVVLGASHDLLKEQIKDTQATTLYHEEWEKGLGASIAFGMKHVMQAYPNIDCVLITLCDLPLITVAHYKALLNALEASGAGIVASQFQDAIGVPVVFQKRYFSALAALTGDQGAKQLLEKNSSDRILVSSEKPYIDIDTPAAYQQLKNTYREYNS